MIKHRDLARALGRRNVADWVIIERTQELATADARRSSRRSEQRTRTSLIVHHDESRGRGTARLELAGHDADPTGIVDQAIALAVAAIGPSWKSVPTAAPAKVEVFDRTLQDRDLDELAASLLAPRPGAPRPAGATVEGTAQIMREQVVVTSRAGLTSKWTASELRVEVLITAHERSLAVTRSARRVADLSLGSMIARAVADLADLAQAGAPTPGRIALVLTADAFLHGDSPHGMWSVFAAQADSVLERQGLTRYRPGIAVAPGVDQLDEPLTITSDGALDFALRSAPVGDDGDAIRRFALVERGIAKGLGLSPREAALRVRDPNGGIRNLVIKPGTWDAVLPAVSARGPSPRTVEVRRLRALSLDSYTGDASFEIALAIEHAGGSRRAFTGGTIRLDLVSALARARRSTATIQRDAYLGPATLLIEDAELLT
ncbi:MAG: metallopeptidase TldD-related protein [Myxococcota bacterium]|nr:metallopeptidase TldD-related protein [Myxococcota bacterium]